VPNDLFAAGGFTSVQRARGDFQAGNPVVVARGAEARLALSVEALTPQRLDQLRVIATGRLALVMSRTKARGAGKSTGAAVTVDLTDDDQCRQIMDLVAAGAVANRPTRAGDACDIATIELAKLCKLLPAAVTAPLASDQDVPQALRVTPEDIRGFRAACANSLTLVSRARVTLRSDIGSEFIVFRDPLGATWTAVMIGAPDLGKPIPVRLHSSCLTGDSFGSLRCDCGDQLRMSIEILRDSGGGVLLYLDQEGCGIGLANKMRAYALQDTGLDTIDANMALGFESDERRYDVAARMLTLLGIRQVFLLTNNPSKVSGLSAAGIEIMGRIPLIAPVHRGNQRYLDAKARRAGHLLDSRHECAEHAPER
jgi:GTP cyclohydrolase II